MTEEIKDRRPIRSRDSSWAKIAARWLQGKGTTPNTISVFSIVFAALSGLFFAIAFIFSNMFLRDLCLLLGALMIQARLICNLLDGMVAVEGGMRSAVGPVYNDLPDRISDTFILLGVGYGLTLYSFAPTLGWLAALLAVLTAYIRLLGGSCGLEQQFSGPMAKQHRMALLTGLSIIALFLENNYAQLLLLAGLCLIIIGTLFTCIFRTRNIMQTLRQRAGE